MKFLGDEYGLIGRIVRGEVKRLKKERPNIFCHSLPRRQLFYAILVESGIDPLVFLIYVP